MSDVLVLVETITLIKKTYIGKAESAHPEYVLDDVTMKSLPALTTEMIDENIVSHRVVSDQEASALTKNRRETVQHHGVSELKDHYKLLNGDLFGVVLRECPFCKFVPKIEDADCLYPIDRQRSVWNLNCYESGGGCGVSVLGWSKFECIDRWNNRK